VLARKPFYRLVVYSLIYQFTNCTNRDCFILSYSAMRRYLRHIYSLSLSSAICPLEYYISSVVHQAPLPVEGGRPFHVVLDAALISVQSKPMSPVIFHLPPPRYVPFVDLDFAGPLRCLTVDSMLAVFTLMLREAKIVFLSCSNTLLTEAMETLRALLFPLTWASCFVSRLPTALHGLLQAPGGLMIGIHVEKSMSSTLTPTQEVRKFISEMRDQYPLVPGTYIIDLTSSSLFQCDAKSIDKLQPYEVEALTKALPIGPKLRLKAKLCHIADDYQIAPQTVGLEEFDSAFDFQASQYDENAISREKWEQFPTMEVRDAFLSFMIDVLGDYARYIIPPVEEAHDNCEHNSYRTFKEEFAVDEYLHDADSSCRPLLDYLMETQMFSMLLQIRSEGQWEGIVFFEQCAELQRELGLSVGGHGMGIAKSTHGVTELPLPIYQLLQKEEEWSALSRLMQQQIIQSKDIKKVYKINCISTSSLSPMRGTTVHGLAVSYSYQNIVNTRLLDLLVFHDFTHSSVIHNQDNESDSPYYFLARKELDRNEDLQLANEDAGPLIIAGPTLNESMDYYKDKNTNSNVNDGEESTVITYSYDAWPELESDRLSSGEQSVHPRVKLIQELRKEALKKVSIYACIF
jgi:hypothetical protein